MIEKLNDLIESSVQEFSTELKKDKITEQQIKIIRGRIINKVKLSAKSDLRIDLFNNPDQKLIKHLEKQVNLVINDYIPQVENNIEVELENVTNMEELIEVFSKELENINKLEEKGKHKEATVRSGRLIRKLKDEIKKIRETENLNANDLDNLEKIEIFLDEQLEWHKNQLKGRYKEEFLREPATFKALVTVLPKGIGLQAKRVINCIERIKESKSNKEKVFNAIELGKEMGVLALTPVIFGVKFIIKHWYLLLLLLSLLKLPKFAWKRSPKEVKENQPQEQVQEQPAYEPATEPVTEYVADPVKDPVQEPVLDPVQDPVLDPVQTPVTETNPRPAIDYQADPRFQARPLQTPVTETVPQSAIDYKTDPRFQAQPVQTPVTETTTRPAIDYQTDPRFQAQPVQTNPVNAVEQTPATSVTAAEPVQTPVVHMEEGSEAYEVYTQMLKRLNERSNGQIYIRELAANPEMGWDASGDVVVCRTPMEYLKGTCDYCGLDINHYLDANGNITSEGYQIMIDRNYGTIAQDTRTSNLIFEDPTGQYLQEFIDGYGGRDRKAVENIYSRFESVNCFETVDEFNAALLNPDPKYDLLRTAVTKFINVSETQEAIQTLEAMGIFLVAEGGLAFLLPESGALTAAELAAARVTTPATFGAIEAFLKLIQLAPEKAMSIYELLHGLQVYSPQLVPSF
jgi:hypothetical protein